WRPSSAAPSWWFSPAPGDDDPVPGPRSIYFVGIVSGRPTLKDVAREAGVHVSTASLARNPATGSGVEPEALKRVVEAAERLGCRPHPLARGLRTTQPMPIGMVSPDGETPPYGPIVAGAESVLVEEGYSLLIGNADRGI